MLTILEVFELRLANKVVLVTGAGSGIGKASSLLFAKEGAKVVVAEINESGGNETVSLIKQAGGEGAFIKTDLTKVDDVERMVEFAAEKYGRLDVLFNNAGTTGVAGITEVSEADWEFNTAVNLKCGFFAVKYALPYLKKSGKASIIYTSSKAGLVASPSSSLYSAAKAGVLGMVRALAIQLAKDNIRVNAICPALTQTGLFKAFITRPGEEDKFDENLKRSLSAIPLGRPADPIEIAYAALFLASDESSYITGVSLPVDGGAYAK
jgi:NAD(P)-dependent dehydrogenase (short-subunit alcohol dehydrogenase family)